MGVSLPNGSLVEISSAFGDPTAVTAISNANPAVATAVNSYAAGDVILLNSGWELADDRGFRVAAPTADGFTIENLSSVNTLNFPVGGGVGQAMVVTDWVEVPNITDIATAGGEQNYWQYQTLRMKNQKQIPTFKSAMSMTTTLLDDPTQAIYQVLEEADASGEVRILRVTLPNGSVILYPVNVGFNNTPTMTLNQGMTVSAAFAMAGQLVRYNS